MAATQHRGTAISACSLLRTWAQICLLRCGCTLTRVCAAAVAVLQCQGQCKLQCLRYTGPEHQLQGQAAAGLQGDQELVAAAAVAAIVAAVAGWYARAMTCRPAESAQAQAQHHHLAGSHGVLTQPARARPSDIRARCTFCRRIVDAIWVQVHAAVWCEVGSRISITSKRMQHHRRHTHLLEPRMLPTALISPFAPIFFTGHAA